MFKKIAILGINFYQTFLSSVLKNVLGINSICKYKISCSQYTKNMISEKGIFLGALFGARRIATCI